MPKLTLLEAQRLSQTTKACREAVWAADAELRELAQVCPAAAAANVSAKLRSACAPVQAWLPVQAPASETVQQLNAVAKLCGAIRAGSTVTVSQLRLPQDSGETDLLLSGAELSPSGTCAAVPRRHRGLAPCVITRPGMTPPRVFEGAGGEGTWAWSPSGNLLGQVCPDDEGRWQETFTSRVFSVERGKWLYHATHWVSETRGIEAETPSYPPLRFARDEQLAAAVISGAEAALPIGATHDMLVVFSSQRKDTAMEFCYEDIEDFCFLPGLPPGHSLLVLGRNEARRPMLLRVGLPFGQLRLGCVISKPVVHSSRMAVVPDGSHTLLVSGNVQDHVEVSLTLSMYSTDTLAAAGSWQHTTSLPQGSVRWLDGQPSAIVFSSSSLALTLPSKTLLFSFDDNAVGACYACIDDLASICFSPDGFWLAGVEDCDVQLYNARTGAVVGCLPPLTAAAQAFSVVWSGWDRLHVGSATRWTKKSGQVKELVYSVLRLT